jgi:ankyrin repeat protein
MSRWAIACSTQAFEVGCLRNLIVADAAIEFTAVCRLFLAGIHLWMAGTKKLNALKKPYLIGDIKALKELIGAGIDLNASLNEDGTTILMIAAGEGQLEIVKLLVERGADINILSEGDSPLISAVCGRHKDVYEFLLPHVKNPEILHIAQKCLPSLTY